MSQKMKRALGMTLGAALLLSAPAALAAPGFIHKVSNSNEIMVAQRQQPDRRPEANRPERPGQNFHRPGQNDNRPGMNQPGPNVNRPGQGQPGQNMNRPGHNVNRPGTNQPGHNVNRPAPNRPHVNLSQHQARELARHRNLTGYKPLPANVRRSMVVGRPIPRHANPHMVPLEMRKRLPHYPGYEWRVAGRDLILVAAGTLIIYQIIDNVFY